MKGSAPSLAYITRPKATPKWPVGLACRGYQLRSCGCLTFSEKFQNSREKSNRTAIFRKVHSKFSQNSEFEIRGSRKIVYHLIISLQFQAYNKGKTKQKQTKTEKEL